MTCSILPRGVSTMRRLVIGDIHGCLIELQDLLDKAALSPGDEIIALGDIVDRGPDSLGVLEFFRTNPIARSLLGNHECWHVQLSRGRTHPSITQKITRLQMGEQAYPAACDFMASLPRSIELPEAILIHGMFYPGVPLADQRDDVIMGMLPGREYIDGTCSKPWYLLYDDDKPLIVGHHDYQGNGEPLIVKDKVFCIDTGCCNGGYLTGLILPDFQLVRVRSRANYWRTLRTEFDNLQPRKWRRAAAWSFERISQACDRLRKQAATHDRADEELARLEAIFKEGAECDQASPSAAPGGTCRSSSPACR